MRPELERLQLIEAYLHRRLPPASATDLEVELLLDPDLRAEVAAQRQLYRGLRAAGRRQLRGELEGIYQKLYRPRWRNWLAYAVTLVRGT